MAYKARVILSKPNEPNAYSGWAPERIVSGVTLSRKFKLYAGDPPKAMLDDDCVLVETLTGKQWPRSSGDRNCKAPHSMRIAQEEGAWPTERERSLQEFAEAKLADPDGVAWHVLKEQGMRDDEIEKTIARSKATSKGIPSLPAKKRGPGRPRKSETVED